MDEDVTEKVAVVTGAAGGIGTEVCRVLIAAGWAVVGADIRPAEQPGDKFAAVIADSTSVGDMAAVVATAVERFGGVDALICTTGRFVMGDFADIELDGWEEAISSNLYSAVVTTRAALPELLRRRGAIVLFASGAGEHGSFRAAAPYAAAKGAVIALTKTLALEVSPYGVRVNAISPGPVDTPMLQVGDDEQRRTAARRSLLGRIGRPEDLAAAVRFLVEDTGSWITGVVLPVNGGLNMYGGLSGVDVEQPA